MGDSFNTRRSDVRKAENAKFMHYAMMACCAVTLMPVAGYFVAGGSIGGIWSTGATFLLLPLCVSGYFAMRKMIEKSPHNGWKDTKEMRAIPLPSDNRVEASHIQRF